MPWSMSVGTEVHSTAEGAVGAGQQVARGGSGSGGSERCSASDACHAGAPSSEPGASLERPATVVAQRCMHVNLAHGMSDLSSWPVRPVMCTTAGGVHTCGNQSHAPDITPLHMADELRTVHQSTAQLRTATTSTDGEAHAASARTLGWQRLRSRPSLQPLAVARVRIPRLGRGQHRLSGAELFTPAPARRESLPMSRKVRASPAAALLLSHAAAEAAAAGVWRVRCSCLAVLDPEADVDAFTFASLCFDAVADSDACADACPCAATASACIGRPWGGQTASTGVEAAVQLAATGGDGSEG
jgi:hypothetical protein